MASLAELLASPQAVGVWTLVPDRSRIGFSNRTFWGVVKVKGSFSDFSAEGQITGTGAVFGRVDVRADSLSTGIGKRDAHLRSEEFFDVGAHPEISVVVTAAEPRDTDRAELRADLRIKGISRPIELPAVVQVLDDGAIRIAGETTIDRTEFGVSGNMIGMMGPKSGVSADLVFRRASA
ncbi:YceI family protein [Mycolicibacterium arseniciresistens]|uniref:YceI family protein n=1 Tax=Mycolicibacterium arseniciresistens TaxID=3062257 RepID=A0ABT8U8L6_9MYCO|nr:YceI family protein [Mycolicibacterium arseniciresistens]MDO3634130.1 YceI family protein [Mycolicibacterium arseniciresistens]